MKQSERLPVASSPEPFSPEEKEYFKNLFTSETPHSMEPPPQIVLFPTKDGLMHEFLGKLLTALQKENQHLIQCVQTNNKIIERLITFLLDAGLL
jgi:hypothetical protein